MKIEGLDKILINLDKLGRSAQSAVQGGMDYGLRDTVNYMKTEFNRDKTGRGFSDQTGNLRNSQDHAIRVEGDNVVGYVHEGEPYAEYVEFRWDGKYAHLMPACQEKGKDVKATLAKAVKQIIGG